MCATLGNWRKVDAAALGFSTALFLSHVGDLVVVFDVGVKVTRFTHQLAVEVVVVLRFGCRFGPGFMAAEDFAIDSVDVFTVTQTGDVGFLGEVAVGVVDVGQQ